MFIKRLISGIIMIAILLAAIVPGGKVTYAAFLIVSMIGVFELNKAFGIEKKITGYLCWAATAVHYFLLSNRLNPPEQYIFVVIYLIALIAVYVFSFPKYDAKDIMVPFFGFFYVSLMLSYIYRLRVEVPRGAYLVWLIFISSWGCDTFAYCVGMLIGKHKMSPVLSPKKSIEGAVGGVVGAVLLTAIYGNVFKTQLALNDYGLVLLCIGTAVAALISMVGDLCASAIKRNNDIKDYGNLIPGHGGILDRFDSVIIVAPIIYYFCLYA